MFFYGASVIVGKNVYNSIFVVIIALTIIVPTITDFNNIVVGVSVEVVVLICVPFAWHIGFGDLNDILLFCV